eukprot:1141296-Pelagomonas_calceolata.AAC.8
MFLALHGTKEQYIHVLQENALRSQAHSPEHMILEPHDTSSTKKGRQASDAPPVVQSAAPAAHTHAAAAQHHCCGWRRTQMPLPLEASHSCPA